MKLSKRLKTIEQMVTPEYDHIWDCCCDHGFLGAALLSRQAANNIHFVDIVPELMDELESKLQRFYTNSTSNWHTHCLSVAALPLAQHKGKHLIIIAGVGGDLMITFIEAIHKMYPEMDIDFLLCPVHHQYSLRQKLNTLDFNLKHEVLVEDNHRFYEVIFVSSKSNQNNPVSLVGSHIWQADSDTQVKVTKHYLKKTLEHYQRIQHGNSMDVSHIIAAYQSITL